ncbi:competence type IV pilus minor pilin ComGG [Niallia sp. JL1B1071]|uniref:competence type IV pilus minor pilin ComGG n=1 Tax=Niallia tiangongensis TaxID=3237105 RepID=UPI0037DCE9BD
MIRNNKGFIYPLSLCVYILFIHFLFVLYGLYENKKGIEISVNNNNMQEYYFLTSSKDVENQLATQDTPIIAGEKVFLHGQINYTITKNSATTYKIDYKLNLQGVKNQLVATSYYDNELHKMTKWVE